MLRVGCDFWRDIEYAVKNLMADAAVALVNSKDLGGLFVYECFATLMLFVWHGAEFGMVDVVYGLWRG